jgi:hypothetical protein
MIDDFIDVWMLLDLLRRSDGTKMYLYSMHYTHFTLFSFPRAPVNLSHRRLGEVPRSLDKSPSPC